MNAIDLNDLYYFAKVVEFGGFAPASRVLGTQKSKLSRRVAALEERLGTQLILRSTRSFAVTDMGRVYYRHCQAMLTEADAAEESVLASHTEPCGKVRISCPVALLATRIGPLLAQFMLRFPRVQLHVEETNRRVDVVAEGFDLALRVRPFPLQDSDLVLRTLANRRQCLVASPALLAQYPTIETFADLARIPSMDLGHPKEEHQWILTGPGQQQQDIRHHPHYTTQSLLALRDAAVAGVGVVQLPRMFITQALAQGDLTVVMPGWEPRLEILHAVYASRRGQLPAVRHLIDFLAEAFAASPDE
ncbi:LysR family transcriptional regulator [Lampropedia puyangensis]|uniref:LysR family transcriptional regulator n=1 Tax=Lampropedia puyangensis TaxID=1330072 RepID=A0A4S8EU86_9BURK|nr:LysR substrate-binding domain-containing protein [Lampropedia puyangensis]THT97830.1 LysR family transcriptional regulator [Lampropedia puyangensis]